MTESQEQVSFFQWVRLFEDRIPALQMVFSTQTGMWTVPQVAARARAEGMRKGVSDIIMLYPSGKYHGLVIEMKFGKNGMTPEQDQFIARSKEYGYQVAVCWNWVQAADVVCGYLGLQTHDPARVYFTT